MKSNYCHIVLEVNVGPLIDERSSRERLKSLWDLEK